MASDEWREDSYVLRTVGLSCATYAMIAIIFFDGLVQPIALVTLWSDRLSAPHWGWIVGACFTVAAAGFFLPAPLSVFRGAVFVAIGMLGSLFFVGLYANNITIKALAHFGGERQIRQSFYESVRHAPDEFQFFLHAASLKRCVPFAWSYRSRSFYEIPPSAAINVLPRDWLAACPSIGAAATRAAYP